MAWLENKLISYIRGGSNIYSDEWLRLGYQKGDKIIISDDKRINYELWYEDNNNDIGVTVNFEYADDSHYGLQYEEFMKLIDALGGGSDYNAILSKFFKDGRPLYKISDFMKSKNIQFNEIHFY